MLVRRQFLLAASASLLPTASSAYVANPLSDDQVLPLLTKLISDGESAGLVAGILDRDRQRIIPVGRSGAPDGRPLDGDTVFEIASITKIFTSLLLADMTLREEVALDDPVRKYLPPHVHMPDYEGREITLRDLVTYAPGLPAWPDNLGALDQTKPFPKYSIDQMYEALGAYKLPYAPGTHYRYSNFGFGLLGHVLSRRGGISYEDLVVSRICAPLGMDSTRITLTSSMRARLAPGHNAKLQPIERWGSSPAFEAAGAFTSTANDLLKFLGAALGRERSTVTAAFVAMLKPRRPINFPKMSVAAGWYVLADHEDELAWKNGDGPGYTSFFGYSPSSHRGIVLLANGECPAILTPMGWHLLNPDFPLKKLG